MQVRELRPELNSTTDLEKERETGHDESTREANTEDLCGNGRPTMQIGGSETDHTGSKELKGETERTRRCKPEGTKRVVGRFCGCKN